MAWPQTVLDCIFPVFCVACGEEGEWWCNNCRAQEPAQPFTFAAGGDLEQVTAFFKFREQSPLARLLHSFKYQYTIDVASVWQAIIKSAEVAAPTGYTVVPVPLYARRERERGFNQAAILAGLVAERWQLPLNASNLVRARSTAQQAKLNRAERLTNVVSAFAWQGRERVPTHVLLIDDVYTTGATMQECAKVLRAAGTLVVQGLVLAHG